MDKVTFYIFVANDITFAIILATLISIFLLTVIFYVASKFKKKAELKLLKIMYIFLYEAVAFIFPLLIVWWLAALLSSVVIFFIRKWYEKQSLTLYFEKVCADEEDYSNHMSEPIVVVSLCTISYLCGLLCFFATSL